MSEPVDYEQFRLEDGSFDLVSAWLHIGLATTIAQNEKAIKWLEDSFSVSHIEGRNGVKAVLTNALLESLGLL